MAKIFILKIIDITNCVRIMEFYHWKVLILGYLLSQDQFSQLCKLMSIILLISDSQSFNNLSSYCF